MSSLPVRTIINQAMGILSSAIGVDFHSTINNYDKISDPKWMTVEYFIDYIDYVCFDSSKSLENGTVDVRIMTKPGEGYTTALTIAGQVIDHFTKFKKAGLSIGAILPPNDVVDGDADGKYYAVVVSLEYIYSN